MWGALIAYLRKQLGQRSDTASATGSIHAKYNYLVVDGITSAIPSDNLKISLDTERTETGQTYVMHKGIFAPYSGVFRVKYDAELSNQAGNNYARLYKNGVAYGTENALGGSWVTYSEDLHFLRGDAIQVYLRAASGATVKVRNFRIYYDTTTTSTLYDA